MEWRNIPSLAALRAFESVSRVGSYSAAARELNVTHAAIAQHVRAIESELQTTLVMREGRGMALTDQGRALADALTAGFSQIISGVEAISHDREIRPITLSVTPSFAENWLMPRFADFWAKYPDFGLSIQPSMEVQDLKRDGIDMAVRYGDGLWPGLEATPLLKVDFTVVAAPALLKGRKVENFDDLNGLPWLFESVHREARRWVMESGMDLSKSTIKEVATFGMVMSAVRAGQYLSVISSALVEDEIKSGKLIALMKKEPAGIGYFIVHPKVVLSKRAKTLKSWLLSAV